MRRVLITEPLSNQNWLLSRYEAISFIKMVELLSLSFFVHQLLMLVEAEDQLKQWKGVMEEDIA